MQIDPKNPPAIYEWTGPTGVRFREVREPSGTYYHDTTPRPVIHALESAMRTDSRVRLFYGDRETGKSWLEENDVCGSVSRSMGPIKIPILIANSNSTGGSGILCDCIVRLLVNGREVYRHPKYQEPNFSIRKIDPSEIAHWHVSKPAKSLVSMGYTHAVDVDGKPHANFKSLAKAQRYVSFMRGERMGK